MTLPFDPRKRLGQHFLIDANLSNRIVDLLSASPNDPVVEIGPGAGALTGILIQRFKDVTAVEIDPRAVSYLRNEFGSALKVVEGDVLGQDWAVISQARGRSLHVIGNLPYNITSPILFSLLHHRQDIIQAVLMIQREVADRLVAKPKSKAYGIPSVLTQLYATVKLHRRVSPNVFNPRPAVESAVVRMDFDKPEIYELDYSLLHTIVRAAFGQRRKMLRNSLSKWTKDLDIELPEQWARLRAEALAPHDYVALTRHIRRRMI